MLIKFDSLSDYIPSGATINKATLSLFATGVYATPGSSNGCKIGDSNRGKKILSRVTKAWDEETVTWTSPWNSSGGDYSQTDYTECSNGNASVWEEYEVTNMIKDFIDNPSSNHGFIIYIRLDDYGCQYPSSESTSDESKRPKLTVDYSGTAINHSLMNRKNNTIEFRNSNNSLSFTVPYNNYSVRIYSPNGKIILSYEGDGYYNTVALNKLSTGVHIVQIKTCDCTYNKLWIINR